MNRHIIIEPGTPDQEYQTAANGHVRPTKITADRNVRPTGTQADRHVRLTGGTAEGDVPERSPSAWRERLPILGLAVLGLLISAYLGAVQLGLIAQPWDPIFGSASSDRVLHSVIDRYLPIPDAVLGVFGYGADIITGALGGRDRWRTWPAITLLFGLVIFGLALVSTLLIFMQTFYLHAWCTLCLGSALISLAVYALGIREPLATLRYQLRHLLVAPPHIPYTA